jgi:diacylglycerol kinase (ATP)
MSNGAAKTRRIKIIANPISGVGRAKRLGRAVTQELRRKGYEVDLLETRRQGDAKEFARDVAGYDRVICIGGDGTMSEVVNGLPLDSAPPLGAVPSGTGNAYAKELGLPWTVSRLADIIDTGEVVDWDVGHNLTLNRRFMMFCGAGFQAEVVRHFQLNRKGTVLMSEYLRWGLHVATTYELPRITVEVDGKIVGRNSPWVEAFNISHYGGPLRLASHASPSDGLFDILLFSGKRIRDIARLLFSAFASFALKYPYRFKEMEFYKGRKVRLFSEDPQVPIHMDGDYCGYLPADLEVLPQKIKLLRGKDE